MSRFLAAAALSACLATSTVMVKAQDRYMPRQDRDAAQDASRHEERREWNEREDKHWHEYLKDRRRRDHDWAKATKREQRDYWRWRDQHPDGQ